MAARTRRPYKLQVLSTHREQKLQGSENNPIRTCRGPVASNTYMAVNLPASKTDLFCHVVEIIIAASTDEACPVRAMKNFLRQDR